MRASRCWLSPPGFTFAPRLQNLPFPLDLFPSHLKRSSNPRYLTISVYWEWSYISPSPNPQGYRPIKAFSLKCKSLVSQMCKLIHVENKMETHRNTQKHMQKTRYRETYRHRHATYIIHDTYTHSTYMNNKRLGQKTALYFCCCIHYFNQLFWGIISEIVPCNLDIKKWNIMTYKT